MTASYPATEAATIVRRNAPQAVVAEGDTLEVRAEYVATAAQALRDDERSDLVFLANLTAIDRRDHFEMVYHLQSLDRNQILTLRARLDDRDAPSLPSLVHVFKGAHLQEREVFDLFGIRFEGHPDLRRMFLWEGFPGYPLRKDFLRMPGPVTAGLPGFPHEAGGNAWPVPGSVPERPRHPNDPGAAGAPEASAPDGAPEENSDDANGSDDSAEGETE